MQRQVGVGALPLGIGRSHGHVRAGRRPLGQAQIGQAQQGVHHPARFVRRFVGHPLFVEAAAEANRVGDQVLAGRGARAGAEFQRPARSAEAPGAQVDPARAVAALVELQLGRATAVVDAHAGVGHPVAAGHLPQRDPVAAGHLGLQREEQATGLFGRQHQVVAAETARAVAGLPGPLGDRARIAGLDDALEAGRVALAHRPDAGPGAQQVRDQVAVDDLGVGQILDDAQAGGAAGNVDQRPLEAPAAVVAPAVARAERDGAPEQAAAVGQRLGRQAAQHPLGRRATAGPQRGDDLRLARVAQHAPQRPPSPAALDPHVDAGQPGPHAAAGPQQVAHQVLTRQLAAAQLLDRAAEHQPQHAVVDLDRDQVHPGG